MLARFVPAMLATASAPLPRRAASMQTASSGVLVPSATTVSPITMGGTPMRAASCAPPRVISSAPAISARNPSASHPSAARVSMADQPRERERDTAARISSIAVTGEVMTMNSVISSS